jgi:hypothetical protein
MFRYPFLFVRGSDTCPTTVYLALLAYFISVIFCN